MNDHAVIQQQTTVILRLISKAFQEPSKIGTIYQQMLLKYRILTLFKLNYLIFVAN